MWSPCLIRSRRPEGRVGVRLGHPVVDDYLEFAAATCRPNTVLAAGYDLKVFFSIIDADPIEVTSGDVLAFIKAQRLAGDPNVIRLVDGESGLSWRTIQRRLSSLSSMYSYLLARGDVAVNPVPKGLSTRRARDRSRCRQKGHVMVMVGIDPHKGSHTAVVIDRDEKVIDEIGVRTSTGQARELQRWASGYPDRVWAVESARGLGYLVSQQLVAAGERVIDVPATMASRVRLLGSGKSQKTDPNDARSVAIAALRHSGLAIVRADDHVRVLGLLAKRHRDVARMKNKAACRLHALLMELIPGGLATEMTVNKAVSLLEQVEVSDEMTRQRVVIATELVEDITRLEAQMKASKKRIRVAVAASGTTLCDIRGIGPIGAAIILGSVGDITRFPTAAHFASYNATAPIEASSGDKKRVPRGDWGCGPLDARSW